MTRNEMMFVVERYISRLEFAVMYETRCERGPRSTRIDAANASRQARADLLEIVRGAIVLTATPPACAV